MYDELDIITVWDDDKIDWKEEYFFGNNREELLARANSPDSESYRFSDITEDIFYVPDFKSRKNIGKMKNGKPIYAEEDCYMYAIPKAKPFIKRQLYKVPLDVKFEGTIALDSYAKDVDEAVALLKESIATTMRYKYPFLEYSVELHKE